MIETLLFNKLTAYILGALTAIILIYLKGRSDASKSRDIADKQAELKVLNEILETHGKNEEVKKDAEETLDKIQSSSSSASKLVELWNKIYGRSG